VQCTACNYKQERFEASGTNVTSLGIGVLLGLGLAALLASNEGKVDTRRTRGFQALRRKARSAPPLPPGAVDDEIRAVRTKRRRKIA